MSRTNVFRDGKVHVQERKCSTCIYRPGNLMHLEPGRREQMERDSDAIEGAIPCHHHIHQGAPIEPVCRGYYDHAIGDGNHMMLRMATMARVIHFTNEDDT